MDTISQSRLRTLSVGYIFSRHPPGLKSASFQCHPLLSHLSPLLILEHPSPKPSCLPANFSLRLHPTRPLPSLTTNSSSSHHPSSDCSNLPRIGRNSLGTASWGAQCRTENAALLVSCKRPAQPAGIGVVLARLFPASPVPSGPVRYGSVRGGAGTDPGAPAAAPVERGSGRLVPYHPRLVSRHFTCGATARLSILPQRLPDADRLELLR